jgi:cobalamin synthase
VSRRPAPIFLERQSYRRRRLGDAAKLLPLVGLVLFCLPILWSHSASTSGGLIYIFVVWALLIVAVLFVSRRLIATGHLDAPQDTAPDTET